MLDRRSTFLIGLLAAVAGSGSLVAPARANDWNNSGLSTQEQRFYDYGPGGSNGSPKAGSILDSTNPIDLMNKIRRGTALDDATAPVDAIDAALKELDAAGPAASKPVQAP